MTLVTCQSVVSTLLKLLMSHLLKGELKTFALAQAVIQTAQPKTNILSLQVGLSGMVDHMLGSEQLLHILWRLDFGIRWWSRCIQTVGNAMGLLKAVGVVKLTYLFSCSLLSTALTTTLIQLLGKGKFHGLDMISVAAWLHSSFSHHCIVRIQSHMKASEACGGRSVKCSIPFSFRCQAESHHVAQCQVIAISQFCSSKCHKIYYNLACWQHSDAYH